MQGIDEVKVEAWLNANIESAQGPYTYDLIAGGRSNITFRVTDANGLQLVLRRPPMGHGTRRRVIHPHAGRFACAPFTDKHGDPMNLPFKHRMQRCM